ncbi:Integral membrane sensor signal transduction histidine kinase [Candidatus Magnetoovum chiemensis]|nr:Integral membrane sensor signal transduction histidine kinase [Candidatus Magnetoovum chiemensis]
MFKHLRIKLKIIGGFTAVLTLSIVIALAGKWGMNKVSESVNNADDINRLVKYIEKAQIEQKNFIIYNDNKYTANALNIIDAMKTQIKTTSEKLPGTIYIEHIENISRALDDYKERFIKYTRLHSKNQTIETNTPQLQEALDNMEQSAHKAELLCINMRAELKNEMLNKMRYADNIISFTALFVIVLGIALSYTITRGITSQLEKHITSITEADKLASIGRLAVGIVHEVNNPITDASLNVELLKEDLSAITDTNQSFQQKLNRIEKDLDRVSAITAELLHFSYPKDLGFIRLNINSIINGALVLMENKLKDYTIERSFNDMPDVCGNPIKLEQVLINVLENSAEAMQNNGAIIIETSYSKGWIKIEITDTGCGIPPKNLPRIFDPFFTDKAKNVGTGLGLTIAYTIISQHKGFISIHSRQNKGAKVTIKLPIAKDEDYA